MTVTSAVPNDGVLLIDKDKTIICKPKRHNGRIGWKARAIQAQQDLKEMRVKMWVCGGIGVAVGAVGVTVMFFILTIVN